MSLDDPIPIDDDGSCDSHAELTLAMARFHRTLLKSFDKRIKKQRKEERRIQKEKKQENTMKREEEKMQRKAKKERSKAKDKKEKGNEKKEKSSEKKEKDIEKKTKKKKEQLKSPKKKKKTKTITVEGSNDDSGGNFDYWWSIGIDDDNIEQDSNSNNNNNKKKKKKKTRTKKKTRMVNKIPKAKKKGKTKGITMEGSEISLSEHDLTETTASLGSSHHWSVVTPVVRKTAEDSAADTTSDFTPYWWDLPPLPSTLTPKDIPLPATPKPNKNYLPLLLSNSHKEDSDRWSHNSSDHDSRSICSVPMRLSPMRTATSFGERTDGSKVEKHLGGIKIVASRENNDQEQ